MKIFLSFFTIICAAVSICRAQTPPITPAWAFKHIVWEDSVNTTDGAIDIVNGYKQRGIPVGAVIIDSPWSTSYNDFDWDNARYNDPTTMINHFKDQNVKVILWLTGNINLLGRDTPRQKGDTYDFAVEKNYGVNNSTPYKWWKGTGIHIDFTNPEAKEWWYSQLDKVFIDGVYGWKVDQGEVYLDSLVSTSKGTMSQELFRRYYYDAMYDYAVSRRDGGLTISRPYSHQGGYEADVEKMNMGWCGDFAGDWKGLKLQIDNIYTSARRGYGAVGCEVAGFFGKRSNRKQFVRYAQFGCMTATMINGGENGAFSNHLPWYHGDDVTDIYKYVVTLHDELAPYMFSCVVDAHLHGGSLIKNTSSEWESHQVGDYIFTKALTSDDDTAEYVLPHNGEWIDFWTGETFPSGTKIEKEFSLAEFPLYMRKGAILPISINGDYSVLGDKSMSGKRGFLIYPGGTTSHVFHLPDGEGIDYTDCLVRFDENNGTIYCDRPDMEKVFVIKGYGKGVNDVKGASSWRYDNDTSTLYIVHDKVSDTMVIN